MGVSYKDAHPEDKACGRYGSGAQVCTVGTTVSANGACAWQRGAQTNCSEAGPRRMSRAGGGHCPFAVVSRRGATTPRHGQSMTRRVATTGGASTGEGIMTWKGVHGRR
jgi:hypothetical protein